MNSIFSAYFNPRKQLIVLLLIFFTPFVTYGVNNNIIGFL